MFKLKMITFSIAVVTFMASCGSTKNSTKEFKINSEKALIGKWKQVEPIVTQIDYVVEFDEHFYTYHFTELDPVKDTYHVYKNLIIGPEQEVVNHRDSIRFEFIHKDTLLLNIKETGKPLTVKHYRLKE